MSSRSSEGVRGKTSSSAPERDDKPAKPLDPPAAGAHAAQHLVNADATPGAGALPGHSVGPGKDVDSGAG